MDFILLQRIGLFTLFKLIELGLCVVAYFIVCLLGYKVARYLDSNDDIPWYRWESFCSEITLIFFQRLYYQHYFLYLKQIGI